jgi:hypothetical protein
MRKRSGRGNTRSVAGFKNIFDWPSEERHTVSGQLRPWETKMLAETSPRMGVNRYLVNACGYQ